MSSTLESINVWLIFSKCSFHKIIFYISYSKTGFWTGNFRNTVIKCLRSTSLMSSFEFFLLQNSTNFQTISLVSIISKLLKKLTSWVFWTRFHCNNSSIKDSISMKINVEIKFLRLKFHKFTKKKVEITKKKANQQRRNKQQTKINQKQQTHSSALWTSVVELLGSSSDHHHHHRRWFDLQLIFLNPNQNHFCDLWVCS